MIITIIGIVILLFLLLIDIEVFLVLSRCIRIQYEGKSYVEIITSHRTRIFGWVQNRDITSIQNNMRKREDHIRVEVKEENRLIQVRTIQEIKKVKSVVKIITGNL